MPNAMTAPRTTEIRKAIKGKRRVRPTWELADYYPKQGDWKEESYIELTDEGVRAEFVDGFVEFFEIPAILHDRLVKLFFLALNAFVSHAKLGEVFLSTTKTKLRDDEIRMPDILLILNERLDKHNDQYFFGADLVMEVVSQDSKSRKRDLVEKRSSYADAKVSAVHGEFKKGQKAKSALLAGFEVDVSEALAGRQ